MTPLVSVVMPAFNAASTIVPAMESVIGQTMTDLELIICDDCSTDSTSESIASLCDSRIKVLRNDTNRGEGFSRDRAIENARGKWIAVIDADDVWKLERLEVLLSAAPTDSDALVFDDLLECHDVVGGTLRPFKRLRGKGALHCPVGQACTPSFEEYILQPRLLMKPIFPREAVRTNGVRHSATRFGADSVFFLRLLSAGCGLRYVDKAMYLYRLTPGSANANPRKHQLMREAIESCTKLGGFSSSQRCALNEKVFQLRRTEQYIAAIQRISSGTLASRLTGTIQLSASPWMVAEFGRRLFDDMIYHVHRIATGGRGRQ